jgi:hypothetical protein
VTSHAKILTVCVETCQTGQRIWTASLSDNLGNWAAVSQDGCSLSFVAYVGYKITAGAAGYKPKTHTVTKQDMDNGYVIICLEDEEKINGPDCQFFSGVMMDNLETTDRPDSIHNTLRRVRLFLRTTPTGSRLVDLYEDTELSGAAIQLLRSDPQLNLEVLRIILESLPFLYEFGGRSMMADSDFIVPDALVDRVIRFISSVRERKEPRFEEALNLVEELAGRARCKTKRQIVKMLEEQPSESAPRS